MSASPNYDGATMIHRYLVRDLDECYGIGYGRPGKWLLDERLSTADLGTAVAICADRGYTVACDEPLGTYRLTR